MRNLTRRIYNAGSTSTNGADALRHWEATVALMTVALISAVSLTADGRAWRGWIIPAAIVVGCFALVILAALLDGLASYSVRNCAAIMLLIVWAAVAFTAIGWRTTADAAWIPAHVRVFVAAGLCVWVVTTLLLMAVALGNGQFTAGSPVFAAIHGQIRRARGDAVGVARSLADNCRTDPIARAQARSVIVGLAQALVTSGDREAIGATIQALTLIVEQTRDQTDPFGGKTVTQAADEVLLRAARAAWLAGDQGALAGVWDRVLPDVGLPRHTRLVSAAMTEFGPRVTIQVPADQSGRAVDPDTLADAVCHFLALPTRKVRGAKGSNSTVIVLDIETRDPFATPTVWDTA